MEYVLLYADPIIALILLVGFTWAWLSRQISSKMYLLFWIGALLGICWELPLFLTGPEFSETPPYRLMAPFPIHPQLQWICHSIWDGGLFMAGLGLVRLILQGPHLQKFDGREQGILIVWGLISSIVLEIVGSFGIWEYIPSWWNPELFKLQSRSITALAPATWVVAPIIFYLISLKVFAK